MRLFFVCLAVLIVSCKAKVKPDETVQARLETAMRQFLYNSVNNDSTKVKYTMQGVNYYEEKNSYDCEFTVRMQLKNVDTVGVMRANITKDYKRVRRLQ